MEAKIKTRVHSKTARNELKVIADSIDEHARLGYPFLLTFFYDEKVPLTNEQKKILEQYLEYHFRNIWANTWLHIESDKIRKVLGIRTKWPWSKDNG